MKLSTKARYSMRLMMAVAKLGRPGRPVPLAEASRRTNVSPGYLGQLATNLSNAGLLESRPGPGGGYLLARARGEITIREIVETAIGPLRLSQCVEDPSRCATYATCSCREIFALVNARIRRDLGRITLSELIAEDWLERLELPESVSCDRPAAGA